MIILVAVGSAVAIYKWFTRPTPGALLVRDVDGDPDNEGLKSTRAARLAAYAFKAQFGDMKYTKANRIIAGDWIRNHFRDQDMRHYDIAMHVPIAVELALLPTVFTVDAANLADDRAVRKRRGAVDLPK